MLTFIYACIYIYSWYGYINVFESNLSALTLTSEVKTQT